MEDGWTLMRDMGTSLTYGNIGYHKRSYDWQNVYGSKVYVNYSGYPTSSDYLQYFGSSSNQAYIYIPVVTQSLKFVEVNARGYHENNFAHIKSNNGTYYKHFTTNSVDGLTSEVIIDMTDKDTASIVYYYENAGIVFLDSIWFK